MFSSSECITWLAVIFTESIAIVAVNMFTIIVFLLTRDLRKRSTYLLINLAVADMLVGALNLDNFNILGANCKLWKDIIPNTRINAISMTALTLCFVICSITNMTVISLERMHATFWPFRHLVLKKWIYGLIISAIWLVAVLLSTTLAFNQFEEARRRYFYIWSSFNLICLFIICISYASILVKVRCGAQPQHHGAVSRERKLTVTLFIVTCVSLVLWVPHV